MQQILNEVSPVPVWAELGPVQPQLVIKVFLSLFRNSFEIKLEVFLRWVLSSLEVVLNSPKLDLKYAEVVSK